MTATSHTERSGWRPSVSVSMKHNGAASLTFGSLMSASFHFGGDVAGSRPGPPSRLVVSPYPQQIRVAVDVLAMRFRLSVELVGGFPKEPLAQRDAQRDMGDLGGLLDQTDIPLGEAHVQPFSRISRMQALHASNASG